METRCPRCGSSDVSKHNKRSTALNDGTKGIVIGGIAGSIIPGVGTLMGALVGGLSGVASNIIDGNKENKVIYRCRSCGYFWNSDKESAQTPDEKVNTTYSNVKERLKELKELKEEGFITENEYETKKKEILKDM